MYDNNASKYLKDLNHASALPGVMEETGVGTASSGGTRQGGEVLPRCARMAGTSRHSRAGIRKNNLFH